MFIINRTILAVLLIVLSLICATFSSFYTKNALGSMVSGIDDILGYTLTQNAEKVTQSTVHLNTQWNSKKFFIKFLIGQNDAREIEEAIKNTIYFSKIEDTEEVRLILSPLKERLRNIIGSFELDLQTIL